MEEIYVPEMDDGAQLELGLSYRSAHVWVPIESIPNMDAMKSAATLTKRNDRTGDEELVSLAREVGNHFVLNKHLFSKWDIPLVDITPTPMFFDFEDKVKIRDAPQQEAWEALRDASNGILNLACGKGKALAHGEPVLTPDGYMPIEEVTTSTKVVGVDGSAYEVTGVYPQGEVDLYEVTTSYGTAIKCSGDHLWKFEGVTEPIATEDIYDDFNNLDTSDLPPYELPAVNPGATRGMLGELLSVVGVRKVERGQATCIRVNSPDRLFLIKNYIPTHNTVLGLKKIASSHTHSLIIVPSTGLLHQWVTEAQRFLALTEDQIGVVQGKRQEWDKPLVVASIQTLTNREIPWDVRFKFGLIIFDECHNMAAPTFIKVAALFYGARFGLTATTERADGMEPLYKSHIGDVIYSDLTQECPAEVEFRQLKTNMSEEQSASIQDRGGQPNTGKYRAWLANNSARNNNLIKMVESLVIDGRKIIVLTHVVDHTEILYKLSQKSRILKKRKMGVVTGLVAATSRRDIVAEADVTFATVGSVAEGIDVAELDTVMFTTPFNSWRWLAQGKGRVERALPNKLQPRCIILDDVRIGINNSMLKKLRYAIRSKLGKNSYKVVK